MNPEQFEDSYAFRKIHSTTIRNAIPDVIESFGDYEFTRSHVAAVLAERDDVRKREIGSLDETVRREIMDLLREGYIQKTGKKKFNRDVYRRVL